jgi:alkylation response protein AidB-like acyl-CoA dehydrogenase
MNKKGGDGMFEFTKQQEMLRSMVREFADTELAPQVLDLNRKGEFPRDLVGKIAQRGLLGMTTSKEWGGSAMGHLAAAMAIEELARVYPSIAFFLADTPGPLYAIEHAGTEDQKKKYLVPIINGEKVICIAATEPTGGSALASLGTEAIPDENGYTINGRKVYISNGGVADCCAVLVKTGERASILMVDKGTPGFIVSRRQDQMGFTGVDVSELAFNECRVPGENLIGKEGGGLAVAMTAFAVNRPAIGAVGLGIARGAFDIALKYAKERVLYNKPISNLQAIQFLLADMDTEIEGARWLIYYPCASLDRGVSPRDLGKFAARAKAVGAEVAISVTQKAMQVLGGYGVSPEYHLAMFLNDAMELVPAAGTAQIMKIIQAMEIIK